MLLLLGVLVSPSVFGEVQGEIEGESTYNENLARLAEGSWRVDPSELLNALGDKVTKEIKSSTKTVLALLLVSVASGAITVLSGSFGEKTSSEAAFFVCFMLMSAMALKCFMIALEYGSSVVGAMNDFITKLTPALMLMLAAGGYGVSAGVFSPVLSGAVYLISVVLEKTLMPLITFGAVLGVAGNVSDRVHISNFCRVVRSVSKWLMAAVITLFTGICAIYGFNAPVLDAMSAKTVKFAVGSLVPVVGSFLSDSLETVISGARLMKNAVGTAGMITILGICIMPIIKIGVISMVLKLCAAVAEPVTDKRISRMLWDVSEAVTTVFGVVIMISVLFLVNISMILAFTGK